MQKDDCCHGIEGFRFWTDSRGRIHVTETPDTTEPMDPPFVLQTPNAPDSIDSIGIARDHAAMLIKTGALRELVKAWRPEQG